MNLSMEHENENKVGAMTAVARSAYETSVGMRAVERAGRKNSEFLKGIVHEVAYCDTVSAQPQNVLDGTRAVLSKSPTAARDDVLLMNAGHVAGRAQLKDTVAGINKTVDQVAAGKYARTCLMGTTETVAAYNTRVEQLAKSGSIVPQKMTSTGISSQDTLRIATQAVGGKVVPSAVAKAAASSGGIGAVISGGIEAVSSGIKLAEGDIDGTEFVDNVVRSTVVGGASAAAGTAASSLVGAGAAAALAGTTAPLWLPGAVALGAAGIAACCVSSVLEEFLWWI